MTRMRTSRIIPLTPAVALLFALPPQAQAQAPRPPVGEQRPQPIEMPRFRERAPGASAPGASPALTIFRLDGTTFMVGGVDQPPPPTEFAAAIVPEAGALSAPGAAILVLSDGQRLAGALGIDRGIPIWVSPWVAPRPLDLEGVRALVFPGGREPTVTNEDTVELRNGDRVFGAIAGIAPDRIIVERGTGDGAERFEIAMGDVLSVGVVGEDRPWEGVRAWLHDGTVINAPKAEWLGSEHLQFPSIQGAKLPVASVPRRIVVAVQATPDSAIPLASMATEAVHPPQVEPANRRESITKPVPADGTWPLDAPPLEIDGPVVLRFTGIGVASRLSCTVARPMAARAGGSPNMVVRSGGKEVVRERLGADRASIAIQATLAPGPFELELSSDDGSIAGCFAVLRQALVLPKH